MWNGIARLILRRKVSILVLIAIVTGVMIYQATGIRISYKFSRILPVDDTVNIQYEDFKETFGAVGNTIVIGALDKDFYTVSHLQHWKYLEDSLKSISGITSVLSINSAYNLKVNEEKGKFEVVSLIDSMPSTDSAALALKEKLFNMPFYDGLLYSDDRDVNLMMVTVAADQLYNKNIIRIVEGVKRVIQHYEAEFNTKVHVSGLPYIRMANTNRVKNEVYLFIFLTILVTSLILLFFLKSIRATLVSLVVVVLGVTFSFGLIASFDFEITILSSLIPPLVIVIGIPNCIFLINKYHQEFKDHGNKVLALQRVIRKIGGVTLLTNTTTALGFAAFILTDSTSLVEFGIVASINILVVFLLSLTIIPIMYAYLEEPKERHYKHLEKKWVRWFVSFLERVVMSYRSVIYIGAAGIVTMGIWGLTKIVTTGNLSDDFRRDDPVYLELKFLEKHFNGVVPLEIVVDTKEAGGVEKGTTLKRLDELQSRLDSIPELSHSVSVVNFLKMARQAFYGGNSSLYGLPNGQERNMIAQYIPANQNENPLLKSLVDSTGQKARVMMQVADIGTPEMKVLEAKIEKIVNEVFEKDKYDVVITGASVTFLAGTNYLIKNLVMSLLLAILVISIIMAVLFGSLRMVIISIVPNLIPLILTAGIMGWFGIPLKPSTILVFSIAFGISVDDTIHYLAKYRQELKSNGWKIGEAVLSAIHETGVSMFYTSIVLFFGFSIFIASDFGGTQALGILVSLTLLFAMLSNLLILPSFLMTLEKWVDARNFSENIIEVYEGEESEQEEVQSNKKA